MWYIALQMSNLAKCRKHVKKVDDVHKMRPRQENHGGSKIGAELSLVDPYKRSLLRMDAKS